ncbi:tetratricopeptide repeat protein [Streptomyces sp. NPDC058319]|uniref:tetratricopeptide repeat protein n=1 Tax=unclassified Streptomyces TaxID=2593676 RepID=UPI0036EEBCC6
MRFPRPDGVEELSAAMAACADDRDSAAWQELLHVLRTADHAAPGAAGLRPPPDAGPSTDPAADPTAGPTEDPAAGPAAGPAADPTAGPSDRAARAAAWHRLAGELSALALRDTATRDALTHWLRRHGPPPPPPQQPPASPAPTSNVISGDAVLEGPVVQARSVSGGIHFHQPAPAPPPPPRPPVPRQLPYLTASFVGREDDRRALDALRAARPAGAPQVLVVSGLPGVGKTTLAVRWLHEQADGFPDGQLYADLGGHTAEETGPRDGGGPASPGTVLEGFLVALGVSAVPVGTAQRAALWRSVTAGLRLAVLLDNAFTAAQVRPLLLGSPAGLTVVTSRNSLTGLRVDGASLHRLEGLPTRSAVELLAVGGGDRVARESAAAHEVVRLCGRLPLTVGLASAQLALRPHRPVAALAESLSRGQGALGSLRIDGEAVMRTALDLSYALLPADAAVLYRRMGLLPTDRHDLPMLAAVTNDGSDGSDGEDTAVDTAVDALVEANLLEETGPETHRFHDLVLPHARRLGEQHEDPAHRAAVLRRYVDWCLVTAGAAELVLTPSHRLPGHDVHAPGVAPAPLAGPEEALAWLDTHRNGLMGAVRHCADAGWDTSCWRLVDLMWPLFLRLRPSAMWLEAHRLGLDAARRCGSREGEGRMLTSGAIGLRDAGEYEEAGEWYGWALAKAVEDGDVRQQAQAVSGLGHIRLQTGRPAEARDHFREALRLREAVGYRRGAALSRRRLGQTALALGELTEAAEQLRRAHDELTALDETYEATRVRALLGHVLCRDGRDAEGVPLLRDALAAFRSGDARSEHWEGRCLEWLGRSAEAHGDTAGAARLYAGALELARRLDPADAERLEDRLRHL